MITKEDVEQHRADEHEAQEQGPEFKPRIIGFLCNWCSYAGADLCGILRYQYPTDIRVIRVMCSTRIDPYVLLHIFHRGADGIFIGGCHPGDCHYMTGNYHTLNKVSVTQQLLSYAGIDPERLRVEWISASEGERFSQVITEFTDRILALGPSEVRDKDKGERLRTNLRGAERASLGFRLRALVGREYSLTEEGNVYGDLVEPPELEAVIKDAVEAEYLRGYILELTTGNPLSVDELAESLGRPKHAVVQQIIALQGNNSLTLDRIEDHIPRYAAATYGGE